MELLKDFLAKSKTKRLKIACVGDLLVDKYFSVKVKRISPEFPIKVMWSEWEDVNSPQILPGGVGNVCYQMKHWNVDTFLVSVIGDNNFFKDFNTEYSAVIKGWQNP